MATKDNAENETAEPLDINAMKQALEQEEKRQAERFIIEYQRLCAEFGLEVWLHAYFGDDGRLVRERTIRKI